MIKFCSIFFLAFSFLFMGCIGPTSKSQLEFARMPPSEHLVAGRKLLNEKKYEESLIEFNEVLKSQTTTPEVPQALFYSATAMQELKRWKEASERLRKFTSTFGAQSSDLIPEAYYRLGLCFEAMNDNGSAIAAFVDALNHMMKDRSPLRVELQARLAGLYAQMGNETEAQKLYESAERELLALRRQQSEVPPWLPKTLFSMGKMSLRPILPENFEGSLRPFERAQIWLLRVARLNNAEWSDPAAKEIIRFFHEAWSIIEEVPLLEDSDRLVALKDQQDRKINMGVSLFNLLSKLKLERGYDFSVENKYEKMVFDSISPLETQLEALLRSRPVDQGLTPAALEREGLKRKGKFIPVPLPKKKGS